MKKALIFIILLFSSVLLFNNCQSIKVTNLKGLKKIDEQSLIYALPQTIVKLEVTTFKTINKKGVFSDFSEKYLGLKNVILKDGETWQMANIKITTEAEADPQHFYVLNVNGNNNSGKFLNLNEKGIIVGINSDFSKCSNNEETNINLLKKEEKYLSYGNLNIKKNSEEKKETVMKKVRKDTSFIKVPIQKKHIKIKSLKEQAEEAAKFITKVRKRRFKLQAAKYKKLPDGKALEVMVDGLNKLEDQYLSLFIGITKIEEKKEVFYFTPNLDDSTKTSLFLFSDIRGIERDLNKNGVPIEIEVLKRNKIYFLKQKYEENYKTKNGIVYRFPEECEVKIWDNEKLLANKKISVSQYGRTLVLPSKILNKKTTVEFYEKTGMLKNIK